MPTAGERAGAVVRSAIRIYLIAAALMFFSGAIAGAWWALAGFRLPNPF
jgi:hypothetical protein